MIHFRNECLANPCPASAICSNNLGSFACACPPGTVRDATGCKKAGECFTDVECPDSAFCKEGKCHDVCDGSCGKVLTITCISRQKANIPLNHFRTHNAPLQIISTLAVALRIRMEILSVNVFPWNVSLAALNVLLIRLASTTVAKTHVCLRTFAEYVENNTISHSNLIV